MQITNPSLRSVLTEIAELEEIHGKNSGGIYLCFAVSPWSRLLHLSKEQDRQRQRETYVFRLHDIARLIVTN